MIVRFVIHGEPRGKGRPRFTKQGRPFTDPKTVKYERQVLAAAQAVMAGRELLDGPVWVRVDAYLAAPASAPKKKRADMLSHRLRPTKTPDWDNIGKIVCDAINGVVFQDDAQVVAGAVIKRWSERPRVEVQVGPISTQEKTDAAAVDTGAA